MGVTGGGFEPPVASHFIADEISALASEDARQWHPDFRPPFAPNS